MRRRRKQPLGHRFRLREGQCLGVSDRFINLTSRNLVYPSQHSRIDLCALDYPSSIHRYRVAGLPKFAELLRHISHIIVLTVASLPEGLELDQRGTLSGSSVLDAAPRSGDHSKKVVSKSSLSVDVEGGRSIGDVGHRHLKLGRRRISELIDLADDHERQLVYRCEVQPFIEIAGARSSITCEAEHHVRLFPKLERKRVARTGRYPRRHRPVVIRNDSVVLDVGKKQSQLASVRWGLVFPEPASHHVFRFDASIEVRREVPRHHREVIARLKLTCASNRSRFLTDAYVNRAEDLTLAI